MSELRAPFPWFGGKSRVAAMVWDRFGDVPGYVEPFFGSGAVLLARPSEPKIETVNDADAYLANFWRAVQADPEAVARHADWPVNEADLHPRHQWLVDRHDELRAAVMADPEWYDVKFAGWWVWGLCQWIGSGWCAKGKPATQLPHLGNAGRGVHRAAETNLADMLCTLSDHLRHVRVCCGDWSRVTGDSVTWRHGITGVFLDPPYADTAKRTAGLYATDSLDVAHDVRKWAIEAGKRTDMRIALCGYEGEHDMPADWDCVAWKANGGYGSQGTDTMGRDNARRERIWFSPHCLSARQASLF
jgi:DNA adenine methylase